ncbi:hypothetical protein ACQEVZ_32345 [Dactylosporangium sp. CA-152071]|uniref:hypothetical protein n=1 Tax=Dactylosporangium TaxID=35753 RepID=UPI0031D56FB2
MIAGLDAGPATVAESGDGRFTLVAYDRDHRHYVLRTTGPFGREGRTDVACTAPGGVQVRAVRFSDGRQVAFDTSDGLTWQVGFSPGSLRPTRILDWCTR